MRKRCGRWGVGVEGVGRREGCYTRTPYMRIILGGIHTSTYIVQFMAPALPLPCTAKIRPLDDPLFEECMCRLPIARVLRRFECAALPLSTNCASPLLDGSIYAVDERVQCIHVQPRTGAGRARKQDTECRESEATLAVFSGAPASEDGHTGVGIFGEITMGTLAKAC